MSPAQVRKQIAHQTTQLASRTLGASLCRLHVMSPDMAALKTGHGNVMPHSLDAGRTDNREKLGRLRTLNFWHSQSAAQNHLERLAQLQTPAPIQKEDTKNKETSHAR